MDSYIVSQFSSILTDFPCYQRKYGLVVLTQYNCDPLVLQLKKLYSEGVIKKDTKCWAQGMHNWKPLVNITQLKWTLVARGTPLLNESDLATLILNMLINMIKYYPCR